MAGAAVVVGVGLVGGVGGDLVVGLAGWGGGERAAVAAFGAEGTLIGLLGGKSVEKSVFVQLGRLAQWGDGSSYRSGCITAFFRIFVVQRRRAIDATPTLCHAFGQGLKEVGSFQAHFADTPVETNLAQAEAVVILFHFGEASLQSDAFASIRFFD